MPLRFRGLVPRRPAIYLLTVAVIAIAYWGLVKLSYRIPLPEEAVLPIWPPAGYVQGVTLLLGGQIWPGISLGALWVVLCSPGTFLWPASLFLVINNTLQPLLGLWLLRQRQFSSDLAHLQDVGAFVALGALAPATLSATVGITYYCLAGNIGWAEFDAAWFKWWIGNVTGVIVLTPLILTARQGWRTLRNFHTPLLIVLWLGLLIGLSWFLFCFPSRMTEAPYPLEYLPFPLVMWGALRLGPAGAAIATAVVTTLATWGITRESGPFLAQADSATQAVLALQAYICVMAFTALILAAVMAERESARVALLEEKEKSERLLLNILPTPIADRLKQEQTTIADHFAEVTVLFADIVDFTQLSARLSPQELVALLNEVFSTFDELAERHNLEKIKTIGDAYMVVGGLPYFRQDHAEAVAEMALDMQMAANCFSQKTQQPLRLRIGVNTGPVVAGVIGTKKFIYDLWGDTVNTASRMEAFGIAEQIQVTETTYEALKHSYTFDCRGEVPVKGKGKMRTYFLTGKQPQLGTPCVDGSVIA